MSNSSFAGELKSASVTEKKNSSIVKLFPPLRYVTLIDVVEALLSCSFFLFKPVFNLSII